MSLDRFFARLDESFEAQCLSFRVFSGVGFSHGKLPNGKAQEVKSYLPLVRDEGVGCPRLLWTQLQSHRF